MRSRSVGTSDASAAKATKPAASSAPAILAPSGVARSRIRGRVPASALDTSATANPVMPAACCRAAGPGGT